MKNFRRIFMLLLALTLALGLFACGGGTECTEHKTRTRTANAIFAKPRLSFPKKMKQKALNSLRTARLNSISSFPPQPQAPLTLRLTSL